MQLTHDRLLAFPGLNGVQGICHMRAFERPGWPVVMAEEL